MVFIIFQIFTSTDLLSQIFTSAFASADLHPLIFACASASADVQAQIFTYASASTDLIILLSDTSLIQTVKQYIQYVNCIYVNSETCYFKIVIMYISRATYYKQYIRKSVQSMRSISKSTFKLMKPVEIYKVHH